MSDSRELADLLPPLGETRMSAREIAEMFDVPQGSVYQWFSSGKLESWVLPGGRRVTTREAVERRLRAVNPPPPRERRATRERSTKARREANRAELKRLGLLA